MLHLWAIAIKYLSIMNKENLRLTAETITDQPLKEWTVPVANYTWIDKLLRRPKERHFVLKRCSVRNMLRVAGIAAKLPIIEDKTKKLQQVAFPLMKDHIHDIVYLIACGIQNDANEPKKSLIDFIYDNFDDEDLFDCTAILLSNVGLQSFIQTILLVTGTDALLVRGQDAKSAKVPA